MGKWFDDWMSIRCDWQPTSRERARGIVEIHIKPKLGESDSQTYRELLGRIDLNARLSRAPLDTSLKPLPGFVLRRAAYKKGQNLPSARTARAFSE